MKGRSNNTSNIVSAGLLFAFCIPIIVPLVPIGTVKPFRTQQIRSNKRCWEFGSGATLRKCNAGLKSKCGFTCIITALLSLISVFRYSSNSSSSFCTTSASMASTPQVRLSISCSSVFNQLTTLSNSFDLQWRWNVCNFSILHVYIYTNYMRFADVIKYTIYAYSLSNNSSSWKMSFVTFTVKRSNKLGHLVM